MNVKATIQVNGRPLRRAYVEHLVLGVGTEMYMTDDEGKIRDKNFNEGIDSFTNNADIRIICQNPIARVLDGNLANIGVYQDRAITDGDTVNLNTNAEQDDYYAILNRIQIAYEIVFNPLSFFNGLSDPVFPLGRKSSLRETRDQAKRIDLSYPDQFASPAAFVEPKRLGDNYPLMHIKSRALDGRLFGEDDDNDGKAEAPTLIPHELAHALHFAFLPESKRGQAQDEYLNFILSDMASGGNGRHWFDKRTTSEVAYIEAGGMFSGRFMEFMRQRQGGASTLVRPEPITPGIHAEFVASEWVRVTRGPSFRGVAVGSRPQIAGIQDLTFIRRLQLRNSRLLRRPDATGGDVEGAVYGAIFVDFSGFVGLDFAASSYFKANALTFGEYRNYIRINHPEHFSILEQVRQFWGL